MISDNNQNLETMEILLVIPFTICSYPGFTVLHALNITNEIRICISKRMVSFQRRALTNYTYNNN